MNFKKSISLIAIALSGGILAQQAYAAIALDRTRVIFDGSSKSMSLNISNKNKELPYLAQGWIEDANGNKIESPLMVLPPLQRLEPGTKSQVKIQATPGVNLLSQDKETLYYFNLREIPPRSTKPNTLQIALQTRIKMFYRPKSLDKTAIQLSELWKEKITLTREGDKYRLNNPTPYYFTAVNITASVNGKELPDFKPVMLAPNSNALLSSNAAEIGSNPVVTYINDYGGRPQLLFHCAGSNCSVAESKEG